MLYQAHLCRDRQNQFVNNCGFSISDSLRTSMFQILHSLEDLRVASEQRFQKVDEPRLNMN